MDVLVKYKRLINRGKSGRWDERDAVTHAAYKGNGRVTMCNRGNPDADTSPMLAFLNAVGNFYQEGRSKR